MRDDTNEGAFQPVVLLKLLDGRLESTRSFLNPTFQALVQLIELLFGAPAACGRGRAPTALPAASVRQVVATLVSSSFEQVQQVVML